MTRKRTTAKRGKRKISRSKKVSPRATRKKTQAQLDQEIDEALSRSSGRSGHRSRLSHAVKIIKRTSAVSLFRARQRLLDALRIETATARVELMKVAGGKGCSIPYESRRAADRPGGGKSCSTLYESRRQLISNR